MIQAATKGTGYGDVSIPSVKSSPYSIHRIRVIFSHREKFHRDPVFRHWSRIKIPDDQIRDQSEGFGIFPSPVTGDDKLRSPEFRRYFAVISS